MGTTPTKALTAARKRLARLERTIETELPHELSKLAATGGFLDLNSDAETVGLEGPNRDRNKARHSKPAAVTKIPHEAGDATHGFTDDGHPTILADPRGWIQHRAITTRR